MIRAKVQFSDVVPAGRVGRRLSVVTRRIREIIDAIANAWDL
jgi:hypothetical protein